MCHVCALPLKLFSLYALLYSSLVKNCVQWAQLKVVLCSKSCPNEVPNGSAQQLSSLVEMFNCSQLIKLTLLKYDEKINCIY